MRVKIFLGIQGRDGLRESRGSEVVGHNPASVASHELCHLRRRADGNRETALNELEELVRKRESAVEVGGWEEVQADVIAVGPRRKLAHRPELWEPDAGVVRREPDQLLAVARLGFEKNEVEGESIADQARNLDHLLEPSTRGARPVMEHPDRVVYRRRLQVLEGRSVGHHRRPDTCVALVRIGQPVRDGHHRRGIRYVSGALPADERRHDRAPSELIAELVRRVFVRVEDDRRPESERDRKGRDVVCKHDVRLDTPKPLEHSDVGGVLPEDVVVPASKKPCEPEGSSGRSARGHTNVYELCSPLLRRAKPGRHNLVSARERSDLAVDTRIDTQITE